MIESEKMLIVVVFESEKMFDQRICIWIANMYGLYD